MVGTVDLYLFFTGRQSFSLAGVPFLYAAGSQFDEMYVGVGAKRIRKLFEEAR